MYYLVNVNQDNTLPLVSYQIATEIYETGTLPSALRR